jgi:hypothetical protein
MPPNQDAQPRVKPDDEISFRKETVSPSEEPTLRDEPGLLEDLAQHLVALPSGPECPSFVHESQSVEGVVRPAQAVG